MGEEGALGCVLGEMRRYGGRGGHGRCSSPPLPQPPVCCLPAPPWPPPQASLAGVVGLSIAMLTETLLLVIRTNRFATYEERFPELFSLDAKKVGLAQRL